MGLPLRILEVAHCILNGVFQGGISDTPKCHLNNEKMLSLSTISLTRITCIDNPRAMYIPLLHSPDAIENIRNKIPFILKDSITWHGGVTLEFLRSTIGEHKVSIHHSNYKSLTFQPKNFTYKFITINELLDQIIANIENPTTYHYYRSLGKRPQKDPSNLESLSPQLQEKFKLPEIFQNLVNDGTYDIHSTVLRIAHPQIELWTHYDIFDNVLIQLMGSKQVILFDPSTISDLQIEASTSPLNVLELQNDPAYKHLFERSCTEILHPGDALFIPSCWPHSVKCINTSAPCISFNSFLESFHIKTVYGNNDSNEMIEALGLLDKVEALIKDLPWTLQATCWSKISLLAKRKLGVVTKKFLSCSNKN